METKQLNGPGDYRVLWETGPRPDMQVLVNALAVAGGEKEFSRISPRAKKLNFNATHHQSQNVKDQQ